MFNITNSSIKYFLLSIILLNSSCVKDIELKKNTTLANKYLTNKIWTLNYLKFEDSLTKSYIGSNAYYIIFYNDSLCKDFDGVTGNYIVKNLNDTLKLDINAKTLRGNIVQSNYIIDHIGPSLLYLSYKSNENKIVTQIYSVKN